MVELFSWQVGRMSQDMGERCVETKHPLAHKMKITSKLNESSVQRLFFV